MLDTFFDKIFVINLEDREDKWLEICQRLTALGIQKFERFPAVKRPLCAYPEQFYADMNLSRIQPEDIEKYLANASGCKQSHLEILKKAQLEGFENILILEDDCVFIDKAMDIFSKAWKEIQTTDWDMFYLGGMHKKRMPPQSFRRHLLRLACTYETHAYAVSRRGYEPLLIALGRYGEEVDVIYAKYIQPQHACFATNPSIAFQDDASSDIVQRRIKPSKKRGWLSSLLRRWLQ